MREVWDALEETTPVRRSTAFKFGDAGRPRRADVGLHRRSIQKFLEELDGSLTVADVRLALEDYQPTREDDVE